MPKYFLTIFMLATYVVLVGCGTKGSLYIPEQRYPQKTQLEAPKVPDAVPASQTTNE